MIHDHHPTAGTPEPALVADPASATALERCDLPVEGMSCASCAARIESGLKGLGGVADAHVNFATRRATVTFDRGAVGPDDLVGLITGLGYAVPGPEVPGGHGHPGPDAEADALRPRLVVAAVLTVPTVLVSMVPGLQFSGWQWIALVLATPVTFWCAWPFHRMTWIGLRHASASMDTLVSLGTLAAYVWSVVALVAFDAAAPGIGSMGMGGSLLAPSGSSHVYFETGSAIIALLLLGRWLEARARRRSGAALRALLELGAKTARLENGDEIPIASLAVGDRFVVRPGEKVATDGRVVDGGSALDVSMLTGESVPVDVAIGDTVYGATMNTSGRLVVEATRIGADTALAQIARLVDEAQGAKAPVQRLADRIAAVFVPVVLVVAVGTLAVWLLAGAAADSAFTAAVAVLIIACPCALGLATPTAILVGTGRGAQLGIVIRGGDVLEQTRSVDTIVLDKTGTITAGRMALVGVVAEPTSTDTDVLRRAAAVEDASEHPIARAVVAGAAERGLVLAPVTNFVAGVGLGVEGTVDGSTVRVGRPAYVAPAADALPADLATAAAAAEALGRSVVFVGWDGAVHGLLVVADTVKPTSAEAVRAFHSLGLQVVMVTGDRRAAADAVAAEVGIDRVVAEALPGDKVDVVAALQAEGHRVAVVGDGVNDAPALARADLGVAIGTGADVAIEASDLTLVSGDLRAAADAIVLARRTLATIKGNLFWAFAYNVAAIPLAAAGLLDPVVAAAAMGFSSVFVVSNSLRLRGFRGYRG